MKRPDSKPSVQARGVSAEPPRNTIRLAPGALESLLVSLDQPGAESKNLNRAFARWPFRRLALPVSIGHPGGNTATIRVACRNLSRGGLSILHSTYLHPGSACTVTLPHAQKGQREVPGKIVRCIHRGGVIHEIGIAFDEPLNIRDVLNPPPFSNLYTLERIEPAALRGTVVLVEPREEDRQQFAHFLRETMLLVQAVTTLEEGLAKPEGIDAVVISIDVPGLSPADCLRRVAELGVKAPVILVAPDTSDRSRERVKDVNPALMIAKPFAEEMLQLAIAEVLLIQSAPATASQATSGGGMRDEKWAESQLQGIGRDLYRHVCARDTRAVKQACARIESLGGAMKWDGLAALANETATALGKIRGSDPILPVVEKLIAACEPGGVRIAVIPAGTPAKGDAKKSKDAA